MRAEVYKRKDGTWDWRMKAENGEIVATSGGQGFGERNDAKESFERIVDATFATDFVLAYVEDEEPEAEWNGEVDFELLEDERSIQGAISSAWWLLNNAHNHDTDDWPGLVVAAREDRQRGLAALARMMARVEGSP